MAGAALGGQSYRALVGVGRRPAAARRKPRRRRVGVVGAASSAVTGDERGEATARHDLLELCAERVVEPGVDERVVDSRAHGDQVRHQEHEHLIRPLGHLNTIHRGVNNYYMI